MPGVLNISPSGDALAFESAIRRAESGSLIILQPGVHLTRGYYAGLGWQLPYNATLRGCGMGNTVLQLVECPSDGWNCAVFSGWGDGGGIQSVSDLTVDLNGQSMPGSTLNAVHLFGEHVSIERVRVINGRGERNLAGANPEAHLLACAPALNATRCVARIHNCVVEQFVAGYGMAFALVPRTSQQFATHGIITDCYANGGGNLGFAGLSAVDTASARLAGNVIEAAGRGFNWDTGDGLRVEIEHNVFLGCSGQGAVLGSGRKCAFRHNEISMAPGSHVAVWVSRLPPFQTTNEEWVIENNRIEGAPGQIAFYCPDPAPPADCRVLNNHCSAGMIAKAPRRGWDEWAYNRSGATLLRPTP